MAEPSPVRDRGAYIDKAVDEAAGNKPAPQPAPAPAPAPAPKKGKSLEERYPGIYGDHSSDTPSHTGPTAQSTDSWNKY